MTTPTFSPSLLHDIHALRSWLTHPSHLAPIKTSYVPTGKKILAERWQIHWLEVLSYLHDKILSSALRVIQYGFIQIGASSLARRVELINLHFNTAKHQLVAVKTHNAALLSLSRNCHQLGSSEIYLQPPLPCSSVQDEGIRALANTDKSEFYIDFFHKKGVCRGMCFWFVYLYFATAAEFSDPIAHITSVAKQFETGAPAPAALLQSLHSIESPLLSLLGEAKQVSFISFKNDRDSFAKYPPGVYSIGLGTHRINYIKISEKEAVLFDPNMGAWRIRGDDQATRSHQYICSAAREFGIMSYGKGKLLLSYCTGIAS